MTYTKNTLSIIVLCRNMKNYLSQCIESILMQGYEKVEIILINDNSLDPVCEIMKAYSNKYGKLITMYVEDSDSLAGGARNRGLKHASGEFVTFVDGDDWLNPKQYHLMMPYFENNDVDMVICDYNEYFMQEGMSLYRQISSLPEGIYIPTETGGMFINESFAWNAIFRHSFLDKIRFNFPEKVLYEDLMIHVAFALSNKIAYIPRPLYQHRKHPQEMTVTASSERHSDIIQVVRLLAKEFNEKVNMDIWRDKFNDLLILYLFNYVHFLMVRGAISMREDILQLCANTFIDLGGILRPNVKKFQLLDSQLRAPSKVLEVLNQMKKSGSDALWK